MGLSPTMQSYQTVDPTTQGMDFYKLLRMMSLGPGASQFTPTGMPIGPNGMPTPYATDPALGVAQTYAQNPAGYGNTMGWGGNPTPAELIAQMRGQPSPLAAPAAPAALSAGVVPPGAGGSVPPPWMAMMQRRRSGLMPTMPSNNPYRNVAAMMPTYAPPRTSAYVTS